MVGERTSSRWFPASGRLPSSRWCPATVIPSRRRLRRTASTRPGHRQWRRTPARRPGPAIGFAPAVQPGAPGRCPELRTAPPVRPEHRDARRATLPARRPPAGMTSPATDPSAVGPRPDPDVRSAPPDMWLTHRNGPERARPPLTSVENGPRPSVQPPILMCEMHMAPPPWTGPAATAPPGRAGQAGPQWPRAGRAGPAAVGAAR